VLEIHGYRNARVEDIAEDAGYSVGNLYRYFDSKEQIFAILLDEVEHLRFEPGLKRAREDSPVFDQVRAAIAHYLRSFPKTQRLWAAIEEAALWDENVRITVVDRWREFRHSTAAVLEDWQERGLLQVQPDSVALASGVVPYLAAAFGITALTEWAAALTYVYRYRPLWPYSVDSITAVWATTLGLPGLGPREAYLTGEPKSVDDFPARAVPDRPAAQLRSAATRDRIVAAASAVIVDLGVQRATIADIAERAGLSAAALYRHFTSKEELVERVLMSPAVELEVPAEPTDVTDAIGKAVKGYFTQASKRATMLRSIADRNLISPPVRAAQAAHRRRVIGALADALHAWQAAGLITTELHPVLAAQSLHDMTERSGHLWFVLRSGNLSVDAATRGISYVWRRMLRPV
jgi:AcrR family transcriptional regulator